MGDSPTNNIPSDCSFRAKTLVPHAIIHTTSDNPEKACACFCQIYYQVMVFNKGKEEKSSKC